MAETLGNEKAVGRNAQGGVMMKKREDKPVLVPSRQVTVRHLATDALAAHQAVGEIAFAGDLVAGSGLTDKHAPDIYRKSKGKLCL